MLGRSVTGKKLIQKVKKLQEENQGLGKELSSLQEGTVQKLEMELATCKEHTENLKQTLKIAEDYGSHLEEEVEAAQVTRFHGPPRREPLERWLQ